MAGLGRESQGLAFPGMACPRRQATLSPTITVLVYNYSVASPAMLAGAEREAGRILWPGWLAGSLAGVPGSGGPPADPQGPLRESARGHRPSGLRVLGAAPAPHEQVPGQRLRFRRSIRFWPACITITRRVAPRAPTPSSRLPIFLGCAIAHRSTARTRTDAGAGGPRPLPSCACSRCRC